MCPEILCSMITISHNIDFGCTGFMLDVRSTNTLPRLTIIMNNLQLRPSPIISNESLNRVNERGQLDTVVVVWPHVSSIR